MTDGSVNTQNIWSLSLYEKGYLSDKRAFYCPSAPRVHGDSSAIWYWCTYGQAFFDPRGTSELLNNGAGGFWRMFTLPLYKVDNPSQTPLLMESLSYFSNVGKRSQSFRVLSLNGSSFDQGAVHLRHSGSAVMSFVDGHVRMMRKRDLAELGFGAYADESGQLIKGLVP